MTLDEFQSEAIRTMPLGWAANIDFHRAVFALGLAGEAGEVIEMVKKAVAHGHPLDAAKLTKELGDVLWYMAALAHAYSINLDTVGAQNVAKLRERYPTGFSHEASINRKEEK